MDLCVNKHRINADVVVVSPLTTEAILGLDFLHQHGAQIYLPGRKISLTDQGITLPLRAPPNRLAPSSRIAVQAIEKIELPPLSMTEIMGRVDTPDVEGTWLLEESTRKRPAASVARSLVQVSSNQVPVRLLNSRTGPITIYAGSEIATLEQMEVPVQRVEAVTNNSKNDIGQKKLELLTDLVSEAEASLIPDKKESSLRFCARLQMSSQYLILTWDKLVH